MKSKKLRNIILIILGIVVVVSLAILFGLFRKTKIDPHVEQPLTAQQMQELIPRGRELALAGDCFGCHSLPQGPMAAGGLAIDTPFGTLYSTNITPDKEYGIGKYTRADYHRVMRDGISLKGNLYPAMPFDFTHITTSDDIDALYAYNMSIPAMPVANKDNTGVFVLPVRPFMNFWTLLNFPDRKAPHNSERSEQWNRGAYLVEGLAHCGACHSPRNIMMGGEFDRALEGGKVDNTAIPDITARTLAQQGFDVDTLTSYLHTGIAPQGTSFAGMNTVTHFSTSAMERNDVEAIAIYLLTDKEGHLSVPLAPPTPLPQAIKPEAGTHMASGRLAYMSHCAGCHGMEGEGVPNVSPAMKGNSTLVMDDPKLLIQAVLNGVPTQTFTNGQRMYAMPPFAHRMSEAEIADLVNWIRAEWGGHAESVTAEQVGALEISIK